MRVSWSVRTALHRATPGVLLAGIILYAALLRLDAITAMYGPVSAPRWLHRLQESRVGASTLRPATVRWHPEPVFPHADGVPSRYRSDPYTYLQYARQMHSFYAAHRREPVFPFATKIFLTLLDDQDVAVSFASAAFSLLAIMATFLLGAETYSVVVGAAAAFLLGIEYDVVYWSCGGWRDDAFTFTVVGSAWSMIRWRRAPTPGNAVLLGVFAAAACLVRITSVSFIVPALAYLLISGSGTRRERLQSLGLAVAIAGCLVAPYVVNCWRVFGDPLYAIDVHADVYRASEGQDIHTAETASQYLGGMVRSHPFRTLDTFLLGMTQYPFANKWAGFDHWRPGLGRYVSVAAVVGLIAFAGTPDGRLLLVVVAGSLLPFAFTWHLVNDWRFTEHAYPFLLLAAALAVITVARGLVPSSIRRLRTERPARSTILVWSSVAAAIVVVTVVVAHVLPVLVFQETLRGDEAAVVTAGDRDGRFFGPQWMLVREPNISTRVTDERRAVVAVPLPSAADYDALIRLNAEQVSILVNGRFVAQCNPGASPERMGTCRFRMPAAASHRGFNDVALVPASPRVRVWYVRVQRAAGE